MAFFSSWKGVRRDLRYLDGGHPCHALRLGEAVAGLRDDHVRLADRQDLQEGPPRQRQARAAAGAALIGWLDVVVILMVVVDGHVALLLRAADGICD